jgi:zinc protease
MRRALSILAVALVACGGPDAAPEDGDGVRTSGGDTTVEVIREAPREPPPESGPAREIRFPAIVRSTLANDFELNTVRAGSLPVVYLRFVVRSGDATDPADEPGTAGFVAAMMKEGTRERSSAELAEDIAFLGADMETGTGRETLVITLRCLSEHLSEAMDILADVALHPAFDSGELRALKEREGDRLRQAANQPRWLAARALYRELYGEHPYAQIDTTAEAIEAISRTDLRRWHRDHVIPNDSFLVAVGDVDPDEVEGLARRHFGNWRSRSVREPTYAEPPTRSEREIVVVDRPQATQSVIYVGNLALPRSSPDFVPLLVANQVLGGSASSRLFMDLRERQGLTYGAYSAVRESPQVAPFIAFAAVQNDFTEAAMAGFVDHLQRIASEQAADAEIADARRYLADSFPLQIETAGRIAAMVEELRVYGLEDDYWESYLGAVRGVTGERAFAAAQRYIRPSEALIVAVGSAARIAEPLRYYGPVRVEDTSGAPIGRFEAMTDEERAAADEARAAAAE